MEVETITPDTKVEIAGVALYVLSIVILAFGASTKWAVYAALAGAVCYVGYLRYVLERAKMIDGDSVELNDDE